MNDNSKENMAEVNVEAICKNCSHDINLHSPKCSKRDHDRLCGCDRLNITELLSLTPRWDGQNFIAIDVEILLAF